MPFTYDEELSLSISDWYNTPMPILSEAFLSVTNPGGAEPVPDAVLMVLCSSPYTKLYTFVNKL